MPCPVWTSGTGKRGQVHFARSTRHGAVPENEPGPFFPPRMTASPTPRWLFRSTKSACGRNESQVLWHGYHSHTRRGCQDISGEHMLFVAHQRPFASRSHARETQTALHDGAVIDPGTMLGAAPEQTATAQTTSGATGPCSARLPRADGPGRTVAIVPRSDATQRDRPFFMIRGDVSPHTPVHDTWSPDTRRYLEGLIMARQMGITSPELSRPRSDSENICSPFRPGSADTQLR